MTRVAYWLLAMPGIAWYKLRVGNSNQWKFGIWLVKNLSFTKNSSLMSADWNSSAVESVDSVPWSESRWARAARKDQNFAKLAHKQHICI